MISMGSSSSQPKKKTQSFYVGYSGNGPGSGGKDLPAPGSEGDSSSQSYAIRKQQRVVNTSPRFSNVQDIPFDNEKAMKTLAGGSFYRR